MGERKALAYLSKLLHDAVDVLAVMQEDDRELAETINASWHEARINEAIEAIDETMAKREAGGDG